MFTKKLMEEMEASFAAQLKRMGGSSEGEAKAARVAQLVQAQAHQGEGAEMERISVHEAQALKCLYASMPMSDAADYPVELFQSFARHGAFLWEKGPFAGRVPERVFAGYVLHHRVNNEDLTEHREFFYEELKDRIVGMDMRQAVLEVNYWCASQVTYRSTDERTASPMCVYRSAYGRCGEESTFTVSVLRSLGIPARQVYVPLWAHCDDNHAWVEVWCDGEWYFLGACEPEEALNRGWFSGGATRAMLIHSRLLLPEVQEDAEGGREGAYVPQILPGKDMCHVLNQIGRYALTVDQEVAVFDRAGNPKADALVCFELMNMACFGEIASIRTDAEGRCRLRTGIGTLHITASGDGSYGECLIDTGKGECCNIVMDGPGHTSETWEDMTILAPKASAKTTATLTEEEKIRGRERLQEMNRLRREKESRFYDEALAEKATAGLGEDERSRCIEIMKKACGNQKEIADFLMEPTGGAFPERWKLPVLESLREKDYRDITADILTENCSQAVSWEGTYEDGILVPYILCPRVQNEMIRPFRSFLTKWLELESRQSGRNLAEEIRKDPVEAWRLVQEKLVSDKSVEYGNLVTSAAGALESGYGSRTTQETVCVQILRTLGIPARLNPIERMPEVWVQESGQPGRFVPMEQQEMTCRLIISGQEGIEWNYFGNWTLARFDEDGYRTLWLGWGEQGKVSGPVSVFPGKYRVLTSNRLPSGNILAKQMCFELADGQEKEIHLMLAQAAVSDMLTEHEIADFALRREDGTKCPISGLVKEKSGLFLWLGEDEEPTEHILNEMFERKEAYGKMASGIYFVAARPQIRENPAFRRTWEALPEAELLYDDFGADCEGLARSLYLEPGKLPLVVLIDRAMRGVYSVAGYNVGTGDMILKLMNAAD